MSFRTLVWKKLGAVARITANRPEVLNAQSLGSADEIEDQKAHETCDQRFGDTARRSV